MTRMINSKVDILSKHVHEYIYIVSFNNMIQSSLQYIIIIMSSALKVDKIIYTCLSSKNI